MSGKCKTMDQRLQLCKSVKMMVVVVAVPDSLAAAMPQLLLLGSQIMGLGVGLALSVHVTFSA